MVRVQPFRAYRPPVTMAPSLAAPPYDTCNSEEARKLADGNEHSFLRVSYHIFVSGTFRDVLPTRVHSGVTLANVYPTLQVNKPEIDLPASISPYDLRVYERGAR